MQPLPARHARRRRHRAAVHGVRQQRARLQDAVDELRAERRRRRGGRACRTAGSGRSSAIRQATLRAGYSVSFNRERMDRFTGIYGDNPGGTINANRNVNNGNLVYPGETLADPASADNARSDRRRPARTAPIDARRACRGRPLSDHARRSRTTSTSSIPTWAGAHAARGPSASSARSPRTRRSKSATSATATSTPGSPKNWNERNIVENGFIDEFKLAQANLRANLAADRGATFALLRRGHRHVAAADLSGVLQRRQRRAGQRRGPLHVDATSAAPRGRGHLSVYNPDPVRRRERPPQQRDVPRERDHAGLRRTSSS